MNSNDIDSLMEYIELDNTELGEACNSILDLYIIHNPYISKALKTCLEKEIKRQLKNYTDHCKIVSVDENITVTKKELQWS